MELLAAGPTTRRHIDSPGTRPVAPSVSDPVLVLEGTLLVHTDDRTVVYEGNTWSESELRCLSCKLDSLLVEVDSSTLTNRAEDWGLWFLEVTDCQQVTLSGIPTGVDQLRRYQAGCHEAIEALDGLDFRSAS